MTKFENRQTLNFTAVGMDGTVTIPHIMTPAQLDDYWQKYQAQLDRITKDEEEHGRSREMAVWADYTLVAHMILDIEHPTIDAEMKRGIVKGEERPYPAVAVAITPLLDKLVRDATTNPTSAAPSTTTANAETD